MCHDGGAAAFVTIWLAVGFLSKNDSVNALALQCTVARSFLIVVKGRKEGRVHCERNLLDA